MYLTQWLYATYAWTEALSPVKIKLTYLDYWEAAATQPGSGLLGGDKTHPLYGMAGC